MEADDWIRAVEKQHNIAQCDDQQKVLYASGQLQGAARTWWESYQSARPNNAPPITWYEFARDFKARHIPAGAIELKQEDFRSLKMGQMSVSEYHDKFAQLSRYAPNEVRQDADKQRLFLKGVYYDLRLQLAGHKYDNFKDLVNRAIVLDNMRTEQDKKRKLKGQGLGSSSRPRFTPYQQRNQNQQNDNQRPPFQQQGGQNSGNSNAITSRNGSSGNIRCYNCGKEGHMSFNYPEKSNNNSRHFSKHGNVNYVSTAAAQKAPEVMLGTFRINSNSATVLFDSGASHTFISQTFVRTHSIPLLALQDPILVNSPGGSIPSSYYSPSIKLLLKGVEFEVSPIVLRATGIDLILGMDWMKQHKASI